MLALDDNIPIDLDVDAGIRKVTAMGVPVEARYWEYRRHRHKRSQLVYVMRGIVNCEVDNAVWVIPPNCAIWIPGGAEHSLRGWGAAECYSLFIDPSRDPMGLSQCHTLSVTLLLRELIIEAAKLPEAYDEEGSEGRLIATLLDQLSVAPVEDFCLPLPQDARIKRMARRLLEHPSDKTTLSEWALRIGMSERNLSRLLLAETGMNFSHWRRQLHVIHALRRLISGELVQNVALDLGYENASGFITMFRKVVGKPPARYLSEGQLCAYHRSCLRRIVTG
ncbi:AraC family transcriptional regulator [Agrobacterium vitis]|uniref:AraC family transcriptional regulator n=1 Tax=Rhizobium/Agrobacterium group TaxID=227290 RepID=UPI001F384520|nr:MULTISPECIES: helix-turn-helix transcriptional regulator [Rhizobium/Agrobacterium group]MCF1501663.1 AraC family transcriptional regulator [Allorhizobium sp. Av2]MCM2438551.1 AraC family transcriptional regulator [Agrobacterium vitis]MCM2473112.1 AraC family transcriptional regulator [Rhizobium sp. CG5]